MAVLRRALVLLAALLLPGCDGHPPTGMDVEASISVHAVLRAGSDTASVLLLRYEPGQEEPFRRLSGAGVRIASFRGTLHLQEAQQGFADCTRSRNPYIPPGAIQTGCYAASVTGGIRAREPYELHVALPSGDSVLGSAVIPAAPVLLAPGSGTRLVVRTDGQGLPEPGMGVFRVRWTAPPEAARIEVGVEPRAVYHQGYPLTGVTCVLEGGSSPRDPAPSDSAVYSVSASYCRRGETPVPWDSVVARLVVTVYDSIYARYAREVLSTESVRRGRASAGLQGAVGVFAGAASAERRLVLLPARE